MPGRAAGIYFLALCSGAYATNASNAGASVCILYSCAGTGN